MKTRICHLQRTFRSMQDLSPVQWPPTRPKAKQVRGNTIRRKRLLLIPSALEEVSLSVNLSHLLQPSSWRTSGVKRPHESELHYPSRTFGVYPNLQIGVCSVDLCNFSSTPLHDSQITNKNIMYVCWQPIKNTDIPCYCRI
jgi:hypothetical protein